MSPDSVFGKKTMVADIIGMDYYVYEYSTHWPWSKLSDHLLALDRMQQWNYNLLPAAMFVEPCDVHGINSTSDPWTPSPSGAQVKNLVWLCVIHGAKAINWFNYFEWFNKPHPTLPAMQQSLAWIEDLAQVILSAPEDVTSNVTITVPAGQRVDYMTRQGSNGLHIFTGDVRDFNNPPILLTVPGDPATAYFNIPQNSFTARINVGGLPAQTVISVYGESRTITSAAGYFEDTFGPHDVHIYVISQ